MDPQCNPSGGSRKTATSIASNSSRELIIPMRGGATRIDEIDLAIIAPYRWRLFHCGDGQQYARTTIRILGQYHTLLMHRLIMGLAFRDPLEVDHCDHDGLNNVRKNLRIATRAQNAKNRSAQTNHTGFKGVMNTGWDFRGRISVGGRRIVSPGFATAAEAGAWYDEMSLLHYGEFASPNPGSPAT